MNTSTPWSKPLVQTPAALPAATPTARTPSAPRAAVPIRSMGVAQRPQMAAHLLALPPPDRYLRFGYAASDELIGRYVDQLDPGRDQLFGIFNRKLELIAMAHLAFLSDPACIHCAEFGVSVSPGARGRGYGSRLFERAVMHARNEGVNLLFIHALTENTAMLKIARSAGATIERDGSESEAHLRLPPADFDSRVVELLDEHVALGDYHLKAQAKQFWSALGRLQDLRQGVRERF
jgi:GNAT superfamily N-acetyltransferase